jgi:hypothetical protein
MSPGFSRRQSEETLQGKKALQGKKRRRKANRSGLASRTVDAQSTQPRKGM